MFETQTNSNEKKKPKVSKSILPENKKYGSESSIYKVKLPSWLKDNLLKSDNTNSDKYSNQRLIAKAFKLAYEAHDGQLRASGEPYIVHPIEVANLLLSLIHI